MEQVRYLKDNYVGVASRVKYGSKGDKVKFIKQSANMVLLENDKEKFWMRAEDVSIEPIRHNTSTSVLETTQPIIIKKQHSKTVQKTKQITAPDNQQKLF